MSSICPRIGEKHLLCPRLSQMLGLSIKSAGTPPTLRRPRQPHSGLYPWSLEWAARSRPRCLSHRDSIAVK